MHRGLTNGGQVSREASLADCTCDSKDSYPLYGGSAIANPTTVNVLPNFNPETQPTNSNPKPLTLNHSNPNPDCNHGLTNAKLTPTSL